MLNSCLLTFSDSLTWLLECQQAACRQVAQISNDSDPTWKAPDWTLFSPMWQQNIGFQLDSLDFPRRVGIFTLLYRRLLLT